MAVTARLIFNLAGFTMDHPNIAGRYFQLRPAVLRNWSVRFGNSKSCEHFCLTITIFFHFLAIPKFRFRNTPYFTFPFVNKKSCDVESVVISIILPCVTTIGSTTFEWVK